MSTFANTGGTSESQYNWCNSHHLHLIRIFPIMCFQISRSIHPGSIPAPCISMATAVPCALHPWHAPGDWVGERGDDRSPFDYQSRAHYTPSRGLGVWSSKSCKRPSCIPKEREPHLAEVIHIWPNCYKNNSYWTLIPHLRHSSIGTPS